jgi:glycosyltransferase involved in cell wall biosynthesis/ADP-heptose:LPS heptosyltransferase/Flp pilus assembly protein TadD
MYFDDGAYIEMERHTLSAPLKAFPHRSAEYDAVAADWLVRYAIELMHIRHIAWHGLGLVDVAKGIGLPVVFSFHDFYAVCPTVKLLDEANVYCGGKCTATKDECRHELWREPDFPPLKHAAIGAWREQLGPVLDKCDAFLTTSESARATLIGVYPCLGKRPFLVIPHGRDFQRFDQIADPIKNGEIIRILIPGNISAAKGLEVIADLGKRAAAQNIELHVLGCAESKLTLPSSVIIHGAYARGEFAERAKAIRPHIGGVFSIWPETYCHTLTELWASGVPVIGLDYGAVGERIRENGAGWLAAEPTAAGVLDIIERLRARPEEQSEKIAAVLAWQRGAATRNNCRNMGHAYLDLYRALVDGLTDAQPDTRYANDADREDAVIEEARSQERLGNYAEAIQILEVGFARDPERLRVARELVRTFVSAGQIQQVIEHGKVYAAQWPQEPDFPLQIGRALAQTGNRQSAVNVLERALGAHPNNLQLGLELARQKSAMLSWNESNEILKRLLKLNPTDARIYHEIGRVQFDTGVFEHARASFLRALDFNPDYHQCLHRLAQIDIRENDLARATGYLSRAIEIAPRRDDYWVDRARLRLALGDTAMALSDARAAIEINPRNFKAGQIIEVVADLQGPEKPSVEIVFAGQTPTKQVMGTGITFTRRASPTDELDDIVGRTPSHWIGLAGEKATTEVAAIARTGQLQVILGRVPRSYGKATFVSDDGECCSFFRRDLLVLLTHTAKTFEKSLANVVLENANIFKSFVFSLRNIPEQLVVHADDVQANAPSTAMLVSRHGNELFGGGEQFLRTLVPIYRQLGYAALIVGMRSDLAGSGETESFRFINIRPTAEEFLTLAIRERPAIIHMLSGIGYEVLAGAKYLTATTIYGTHYWRDMFEDVGGYLNVDREATAKVEFANIIQHASAIYSNSHYTAEVKRHTFDVSTPVIYSLPRDFSGGRRIDGNYVLLVNARAEKGFDLLLDVAQRLPKVRFAAIASQSDPTQAEAVVRSRGMRNVKILGKTADMDEVYAAARVVVVPSYAFVETFSRVVIEAHRHGIPVVGSDRGNVPYLLEESGVSLPEDADAWAFEIGRLFEDDEYWEYRSKLAIENSARYAFAKQYERISKLVAYTKKPIIVAVGAGIGNIVQSTPLIKKLSRHFNQPVDVLINEDFPGCSALVEGAPFVNMVFTVGRDVLQRPYDFVYVTHSYGENIPSFNSQNVVVPRRKFPFAMTRNMHEAEFNFLCARETLGIEYDPDEWRSYFVGKFRGTPTTQGVIGIHAGGKAGEWVTGTWLNKRWPYYSDLVRELSVRGFRLASFGSPEEYVPGTDNLTGTDLHTTIANIASCRYFIANDSGLMHIADALEIPLSAIFGPTSVLKNGPLAKSSRVVALKKDCAPCQFDARFATCTCISEIAIAEVLHDVLSGLHQSEFSAKLPTKPDLGHDGPTFRQ